MHIQTPHFTLQKKLTGEKMNFTTTSDFLKKNFSQHYKKNPVPAPSIIFQREFGTGELGKKITTRHMSFANEKELNKFLTETAPLFISASAAYYSYPSKKPMSAKEWLGGELVYEFDADDLKPECFNTHTYWKCTNCKKEGKGAPELCDECAGSVKTEEWTCPSCLEATKKELSKLTHVLENELGINEGFSTNFSGNKGFHLHIETKQVQTLPPSARTELVDYLTANSINTEELGFGILEKAMKCPPIEKAQGWQKKIMTTLKQLFEEQNPTKIAAIAGIRTTTAQKLLNERSKIINGFEEGLLYPMPQKTKVFWLKLIDYATEKNKILLDRSTSIDPSKLIRLPETIHGGTGLNAKKIEHNEIKKFNGFEHAIVFGEEETKLQSVNAKTFFLNKKKFGPYQDEEVTLPLYAAIYLLCRGNANGIII
jgi:DNA primase small subunit